MPLKIFILSLLLVPALVSACEQDEVLIFECASKEKIVSVCKLPARNLSLRYQFGIAGQKPEMQYPEQPKSAQNLFKYNYTGLSQGQRNELSFLRGNYEYVVYHTENKNEYSEMQPEAGVLVRKNSEDIADIKCELKSVKDQMFEVLSGAGLPERK